MSSSAEWREVVELIAGAPIPARSPELAHLYRIACEEGRHALRRFPQDLRAQVDDLVHDILFDKLGAILGATNPRGLFIITVRNAAIDLQRRQGRVDLDDGTTAERSRSPARSADQVVDARREAERVAALLSPREQQIFAAIADGEDRDDIAAALGTSRANIDQLVSRARRRLTEEP